jgi:hypothetical protein
VEWGCEKLLARSPRCTGGWKLEDIGHTLGAACLGAAAKNADIDFWPTGGRPVFFGGIMRILGRLVVTDQISKMARTQSLDGLNPMKLRYVYTRCTQAMLKTI